MCRVLIAGGRDAGPRGRPNSFDFMQFSGKFGKSVYWCPMSSFLGTLGVAELAHGVLLAYTYLDPYVVQSPQNTIDLRI